MPSVPIRWWPWLCDVREHLPSLGAVTVALAPAMSVVCLLSPQQSPCWEHSAKLLLGTLVSGC